MNIKTLVNSAMLLLVLICWTGCRRFVNPFTSDKVLAWVGDRQLTLSQVKGIFTPGMTSEDSVKVLESYVYMWTKKQLKIQAAEQLFPESVPEIERMVEEYRGSLLSVKFDNYFTECGQDTVFSAKDVAEYYNANKADFLLDRRIVRGRVVKVPATYRQNKRIKELLRWDNETQKKDFTELCAKNNFEFREFAAWTDLSDFLSALPQNRKATDETIFRTDAVQELQDAGTLYYLLVTDRRSVGDALPLERVEGTIKRVLENKRRTEIIRSMEDSIYREALKNKQIVINVE